VFSAAVNLATDPDDEARRQTLKWNVEADSLLCRCQWRTGSDSVLQKIEREKL
jgi:hypothetical protein